MSREEVRETIRDARTQIGVIAFSGTKAGEEKRAELEARIGYLEELLRGMGEA